MPSSIINSDDGVISGTSGLKTTGGDDGVLNIQNNGTTAVTVNASGNVGVGTSSPSEKLDVIANASGADGAIRVRTQSGSGYFGAVGNYPAFGYKTGGVLYAALAYDTNNNFLFTGPESAKQPAYLCRAWVNFNGTGTVAIREAGNVSSITDNGTGDYTVNFTTAMPDANYSFVFGNQFSSDTTATQFVAASSTVNPTTSALKIRTLFPTIAYQDVPFACVAIFR